MLHSRLAKGLRAVALFEIAKGLIGLWVGSRLLIRGKDYVLGTADWTVRHLHLDRALGLGQKLLQGANHIDSGTLVMLVALAFAYTAVRFAEAYGLWRQRAWAEWFAVLSGGLYIPFELAEVIRHIHWWKVMLLGGNIAIVAFLVKVLMETRKLKATAKTAQITSPVSAPE